MKNSRVATYIDADGVKHTIGEYHEPRPSERTWPLNKSKHTVWAKVCPITLVAFVELLVLLTRLNYALF